MNESRIGVLLVNLGTPTEPTAPAIRRFLREFLHDRRVVELTRWIWCPLLHGVILPFRPRALVHKYQSVWTARGSPLLAHSLDQQQALQDALPDMTVLLAMRYGEPSLREALATARRSGVKRMLVLPLYPQYSATTTATTFDAVAKLLRDERELPELRFINDYHQDNNYIAALATSVQTHWQQHGRGERLLMSFHGLPQRFVDQGDPYAAQCETTARLLAQQLAMKPGSWQLCYQSRLGRAKWLQPYSEATVRQLAQEGVKIVDVICPGFAADCLETLEEIRQQLRDSFRSAGGQELRYIPALNAGPVHIRTLTALVQDHTQGWQAAALA